MNKLIKILLNAVYFGGLILLVSTVTLLVVGTISWIVGWRTFAQYANILMYAGTAIILFGFLMFDGDPSATNDFRLRGIREKLFVSIEPHKYEAVNKMMKYRLNGHVLAAFFAIVGALMILCSILVHAYLVN